jgi:hypothetical protein
LAQSTFGFKCTGRRVVRLTRLRPYHEIAAHSPRIA